MDFKDDNRKMLVDRKMIEWKMIKIIMDFKDKNRVTF